MIGEDLALQELNSNIMKEKEIKIEVPAGYEIDRERSTFDIIRLKKKEVEFEHFKFEGVWINEASDILSTPFNTKSIVGRDSNKNIWISKAHAKASLAMGQLSVLMASPTYNGDWVADWEDDMTDKYIIYFVDSEVEKTRSRCRSHFLSFKTEDARDRFLENHRGLIIEAKILL